MPNSIVITIVQKPNGNIGPQEDATTTGIRTKVPSGAAVEFRPGGGATGVEVFFDRGSPFGDAPQHRERVRAGTVQKPFDAANPHKNVYVYRCVLTIGGQQVTWPPPGQPGQGGEMEIIRGH